MSLRPSSILLTDLRMVEIVNVPSGATSFTDEQPFRRLTSDFSKMLRTPQASVLLLTETGVAVDPWTLLTRGKYFLLRKDQFLLDRIDIGPLIARPCAVSQIEAPYTQAFSFRRTDGVFGSPVVRETELGLFTTMNAAKTLYDQCLTLLGLLPEWQTLAQNRSEAIKAILLGLKRYYKALKRKELALGEKLDALPVLRENYRDQLRRVSSEEQTPTLAAMLKFLSDHDFGKLYKRKHDQAKVKRAAIHGKITRLKERIRTQEISLSQCMDECKSELETVTQKAKEAESTILGKVVEVLSAYVMLRQELERLVSLPRGSHPRIEIPTDLGNLRAADAQLRDIEGLTGTLTAQVGRVLDTHRLQCERIAHMAAKVTSELHIKVQEKLPKLEALVTALGEHTHLLTLPDQAPAICASLDAEIKRRTATEQSILSDYFQLEDMRKTEEQQRMEFLQRWGNVIPAAALPDGFSELPSLQDLLQEIRSFANLPPADDPYISQLTTLIQRKRHLEEVEQLLKSQLSEQEALTEEIKNNLGRIPAPKLDPSPVLLADFKQLAEEQMQYLKGLKKERS